MSGVALVTGAGKGLGRAVAERLAAVGSHVVLAARTAGDVQQVATAIEAGGGRATWHAVDVTDPIGVRQLVNTIDDEVGGVDLLVNNAGGYRAVGPLWTLDVDTWWSDVELNFKAAVLCTRAVLPAMLARGAGRVVNVGSGAAARPVAGLDAYSSAKAALTQFGEGVERSLAGSGVHVFTYDPGPMATPGADEVLESDRGNTYLTGLAEVVRPIRRSPESVAESLTTLVSGRYDALGGRVVGPGDDFGALLDEVASAGDRCRRLRLGR